MTALVVPRIRGLSSLVAAGAVTMSLGAFGPWSGSERSPYYQVEALVAADDVVPDDGVLVGALSGVVVDRVFSHHTERQFVPLNPFSEYATFFVGRAGEERAGTFAFTGWNAERIDDLLTSGRRVFFLRQGLADGLEFEKRYELTPVGLPPYPDSLLMELRFKWRPQLRVEFAGPDESASPYLRDGWNLEESGPVFIRWKGTLGHEATMVLPLDADGPVMVQMSVGPSQAGRQGVTVVANGQTVASLVLVLENTFRQYSFVIPFAAVREFNQLELKFLQPYATSPQSSGPNTIETTEVGIPFLWLSLSFCDTGEC